MKNNYFLLLLLLFLGQLSLGCESYRRVQQVRTFSDMQTIVAKLQQVLAGHAGDPNELISSVNGGRDAWGSKFRFYQTGNRTHYVLVSWGSDRKPDSADPNQYFSLAVQDIRTQPWRDIVFRDGVPVTLAGK
jgi:hypothetical protein